MRVANSWIIKTFTGYSCCLITTRGIFTVIHRPFRQPILKYEEQPSSKLNGFKITGVFIDEAEEIKEGEI
jgi:hypothetical protein